MSPYHTTTNAAVFTASKSYVIIIVTNSTAKVTINKLKSTQLQHKAGISSTLSEILYTYTHEHHSLCSFYGHRPTTGIQSHDNNNTHTHITKVTASVCRTCQTTFQVHACNHSKQQTLVILVTTL
jgi:hypothetical protein